MFLVGWRLEIETLKTVGRMALVTSVVSIAVPFALGSAVAVVAWYPYAPTAWRCCRLRCSWDRR